MQTVMTHSRFNQFWSNLAASYHWAWMDVRCRYRRSVIGPFWETINVFVTIIGMSYVASAVFGSDPRNNLSYVGLGIIIWTAISALINESTNCFTSHKELIKNSNLSIDIYIGRTVFRILITSAHHFLLYFIGLLLLPIPLTPVVLLSSIGFAFLLLNAFWAMPVFGFLCARFRDLEMVIRNLLQLVFFVTPIFWNYQTVSDSRKFILNYNPFFYLLEAIRRPLLGGTLPLKHYAILAAITATGYLLLALCYSRMRRYLAFYV